MELEGLYKLLDAMFRQAYAGKQQQQQPQPQQGMWLDYGGPFDKYMGQPFSALESMVAPPPPPPPQAPFTSPEERQAFAPELRRALWPTAKPSTGWGE